MKAVRIEKPRIAEIYEVSEPQIKEPYDVKIKVSYAGICVDDLPFFRKDNDMLAWGPILFPLVGHEMSGIVVDVGDAARKDGFNEGDRVSGYAWNLCGRCYYCRSGKEGHCLNIKPSQGTFAEYIVWNSKQLIKLPQSISLEEGCLTDPIGYSLHGIDRANIKFGNKTMIIGATVPGLILLQMAKMQGATQLTVVDPVDSNRELAMKFGAEHVIDPNKQNMSSIAYRITKQMGYDTIFETSINIRMLSFASKVLARQGTLLFSSIYGINQNLPINIAELYLKEATLKPFYIAPYMLPRVRDIMEKLELKQIITKVFDFTDVSKAFEASETGLYPKVLVKIS